MSNTHTYVLARRITPTEILLLNQMVEGLIEIKPSIKAVIYLGTVTEPLKYYLYILIAAKEYQSDYLLNEQIEENCKRIASVFTLIDKLDLNDEKPSTGKSFFNYAVETGTILYPTDRVNKNEIVSASSLFINRSTRQTWEHYRHQGEAFLKLSDLFRKNQDYHFSLYFLHSSIEGILLGVLGVLTGYETIIPNFTRLLQMSLLVTNEIQQVFETTTDTDKALFKLLLDVYPIETRMSLKITDLDIKLLRGRVLNLFKIANELVKHHI